MSDQRNLILAIVLSVVIIVAFQLLYSATGLQPTNQEQARPQPTTTEQVGRSPAAPGAETPAVPGAAASSTVTRPEAVSGGGRVRIANGRLNGSIDLTGGRIDDVTLADYFATTERRDEIQILSPTNAPNPYFAEFGWVAPDGTTPVPGPDTVWRRTGPPGDLARDGTVMLRWDNGRNLRFERDIGLDENFMFSVTQRVTNTGDRPVTLLPYGRIQRGGELPRSDVWILHEGPIGVLDGTLQEWNYDDLNEETATFRSRGGWLGITDKYWLTSLVPDQTAPLTANFRHVPTEGGDRYQADYTREAVTVQPGQTLALNDHLFVGAKEVTLLESYAAEFNIPLFDRAVDFGYLWFLTKPIFHVLHFIFGVVGNYGVAILVLTLLVKLLFYPLANKSYRAMSKMKKLTPEMTRLREQHGDDKVKLQQEMMALYKKEGANPMSGCLPIIVQIPVFFALYKVLYVSIEMRHAPFFGWITDLSEPDPTSLFNLFGLLPFAVPAFLMIGVWPLLMGLTMFLQQRLNPQPPDPVQAKIMMFLPLMFIFLFATFPAGLVIYWAWNNTLSVAQQWLIMRRMGVPA